MFSQNIEIYNTNKYNYYNSPENYLYFEKNLSKWSYDISINDIKDKVEYDNLNSILTVYHPIIGRKAVSRIIKNSNSYSFN